ncbi:MAG: NUDIX hydrolase [Dehalococcoidia bacterium]|jgi:8-oxo-dGTP diphosphatase
MNFSYPKYTAILAAAAVVVRDGRLLLLEDRWGRWGLPSGFLEDGESPEETIRREVLEELGIECEVLAPFKTVVDWKGPEGSVFVLFRYTVRLRSNDFLPNEEVVRFEWVPFDELKRYNVWPNVLLLTEEIGTPAPPEGRRPTS